MYEKLFFLLLLSKITINFFFFRFYGTLLKRINVAQRNCQWRVCSSDANLKHFVID